MSPFKPSSLCCSYRTILKKYLLRWTTYSSQSKGRKVQRVYVRQVLLSEHGPLTSDEINMRMSCNLFESTLYKRQDHKRTNPKSGYLFHQTWVKYYPNRVIFLYLSHVSTKCLRFAQSYRHSGSSLILFQYLWHLQQNRNKFSFRAVKIFTPSIGSYAPKWYNRGKRILFSRLGLIDIDYPQMRWKESMPISFLADRNF